MNLRILLLLGALCAFGPLAIDFYLPSFPALAQAFATDVERVQLTLAVYFIGLAGGQLIYGPLADRFGRRRPLIFGVLLFSVASAVCALATSLEWLIAARFLQALGGCAGMVISRAVVRDLCDPLASAKVFSQLMLVMGLAPILAPLAGGVLLTHFGWQSIFISLTLFSGLCALAVAWWLPETLTRHSTPASLRAAPRQYLRLLADPQFVGHALTGGLVMAGMFAYIAGSPFVFIELYKVPAQSYGWLFGSNAAGFILFAQINSRLLRRHGPAYWLRRSVWVYLAGALVLLAISLAQPTQLWPLLLPLFVVVASLGCILPNASACAMAGQAAHAGSASALLGFIQFGLAAGASALVGALHNGTAQPLALVVSLCAALAVICALVTARSPRVV
ncbi:MAG: Bcr/CflA family multidrug efflux MFS transporter [Pseudomonas sp.]|uniref:Bcr/CflA family multidrug efflux MFS transporter n=1 Tax=Pseudomonas sp. TaxID=306 RepID=UPI0027360C30|nr:Bcr/CflA family multidrug efflux MFS transporter [Pseudomonas sp.]MDP3845304.1 Bcr/CflA family multidrug efflux MFS transporter [Pseudomonas sp.]